MKIFGELLQLLGMMCNEILGQRRNIQRGKKICNFHNVKGQDCLHAMYHEKWGVTNRLMDSDSVCPKDEGSHVDPLGVLIIAGLHERFTNVEVFLLDNTIILGVIRGDLNVMDAIFFGQITSRSHECGTIVSNNFRNSTP